MENLMKQLQEYFYNQFPIIEQNNLIVIITALVIALLYVFFGYKLLRVYISLLGFLIGFALGIVICAVFDLSNTTAVIVIICVCAVALAALGFWLYKAGLFIMILLSLFPVILSVVSEFTTVEPVFMWIRSLNSCGAFGKRSSSVPLAPGTGSEAKKGSQTGRVIIFRRKRTKKAGET